MNGIKKSFTNEPTRAGRCTMIKIENGKEVIVKVEKERITTRTIKAEKKTQEQLQQELVNIQDELDILKAKLLIEQAELENIEKQGGNNE